jgi:ribosomal protein S18 acetylase RimI-like enzyme
MKTTNQLTTTESMPLTEENSYPTLLDFLPQTVGGNLDELTRLNDFFNSSQIKSELHWFTHRETLKRAASRDDRRLFYYRPFDKILGGLMVWCKSRVLRDHQAQIRLVAVHPAYRRYGIGRSLVNKAIGFAKSYNRSTMIADVAANSPAVKFWEACGFTQSGEYETKGGREMYQMKCQIDYQ